MRSTSPDGIAWSRAARYMIECAVTPAVIWLLNGEAMRKCMFGRSTWRHTHSSTQITHSTTDWHRPNTNSLVLLIFYWGGLKRTGGEGRGAITVCGQTIHTYQRAPRLASPDANKQVKAPAICVCFVLCELLLWQLLLLG